MAVFRTADAARNSALNALRDLIDAGAGAGTIKVYTGTMPADADDTISTQTLLGTLTFSDPCAPNAATGVLSFDPITEDSAADASGTATWARIEDSDGNNVCDVDIGTVGSGAFIEMNTTTIVVGGPIRITSFTIIFSAG